MNRFSQQILSSIQRVNTSIRQYQTPMKEPVCASIQGGTNKKVFGLPWVDVRTVYQVFYRLLSGK